MRTGETLIHKVMMIKEPKVPQILYSISSFAGFGCGFVYAPSLFVLNQYFTRRRAIALGLGTCGQGVGFFAIPPLFKIVLEKYSYFGTMILLGGIWLNACVCGALYRPIRNLRKARKDNWKQSEHHTNTAITNELYANEQHVNKKNENEDGNDRVQRCSSESQISNKELEEQNFDRSHSNKKDTSLQKHNIEHQNIGASKTDEMETTYITSSQQKGLTKSCERTDLLKMVKAFMSNFKMLHNSLYCVFLLVFFLNQIGYFSTTQLLAALMKEKLLDDAVLMLSIVGISEIPVRLLSGLLFDLNYVCMIRPYIYACAFGVHGVWMLMAAFAQSDAMFVAGSILAGISRGMIMAQSSVILVDLFGVENLSQIIGFFIGVLGLATIASPLIMGTLKSKHLSFTCNRFRNNVSLQISHLIKSNKITI